MDYDLKTLLHCTPVLIFVRGKPRAKILFQYSGHADVYVRSICGLYAALYKHRPWSTIDPMTEIGLVSQLYRQIYELTTLHWTVLQGAVIIAKRFEFNGLKCC